MLGGWVLDYATRARIEGLRIFLWVAAAMIGIGLLALPEELVGELTRSEFPPIATSGWVWIVIGTSCALGGLACHLWVSEPPPVMTYSQETTAREEEKRALHREWEETFGEPVPDGYGFNSKGELVELKEPTHPREG